MKRLIAIALTLTALALTTSAAYAQDLPMLGSEDMLRTYALEQLANVNAQIYTSLPVGNNSYGYVPIQEPTAAGISNTISAMNLSVDVANPKDPLYIWGGAYNSDGDPLFTGYNQFNLVNGKGGYTMPTGYGNFTMTLYDNIPIKVSGAESAIVDILGPNGQTEAEYSLNVQNGKVYFPRSLAGTNAILAVYTNSTTIGSTGGYAYWNVGNGTQIQTLHFAVTLDTTVQGVVSFTDTNNVFVAVPTTNSIGNNLTAEFKATGKELISVSFWTTEGKWFTGAWVRKAGTSQWQPYAAVVDKQAGMMDITLPITSPGIYYIIPAWNQGDLVVPADPFYPPYDYGDAKD